MATQFAQDAQQYTQMVEIPSEYQRHAKVFDKEASNQFPPSRSWDHAIELKEDAPRAIDCKVYPMMPTEDEALLKFLKDMQKRGYIRPSKSPFTSSFFFIRKKDGKLRPVQDYRKLNQWTIPNRYPLPLILELIAQLRTLKYSPNLMSDKDTTTYASKKETNTKQRSKPNTDYLNH
jgi:hypothetical protein